MELTRKCSKCGVIISYAKGDVAAGRIPANPLCPKCKKKESAKVLRGEDFRGSFKAESPFPAEEIHPEEGEIVKPEKKKNRRFGKDEEETT